jgi:hypothetical protein
MPLLLAACGGGGDGSCSVADQQSWLRSYMGEWYFWYRNAPSPDPSAFATVDTYFQALLYGGDATFPADRYSYHESTESFNQFFGDGVTLGYGIFVAGLEVTGQPDQPLRVRYIEAQSDAAAKGVLRGEQVLSVNGRPASELIAADDFSVLTPANPGETITVVLRGSGGDRSVTLTASAYPLTPVSTTAIVSSPLGRKVGYVVVKDMINQVQAPLDAAFMQFKAQGVSDVVLDLRYNGGGLVTMGRTVASYVGGNRSAGATYAQLLYNDQRAQYNNQTVPFQNPSAALGLARVYVLTGQRTCSASEQVINGLRPFVDVVTLGDTTCGKPVGFLPAPYCGTTFSVVNFESVNRDNAGRYFDGFLPTCAEADDLSHPLGSPAEGLLAAALQHADTGVCAVTARARPLAVRKPGQRSTEAGERQGMVVR